MEVVSNRALQDRRRLSRVPTQMICRFISDDKEYDALLLDLSHEGAFLSSTFLPARQSKILITFEADCLKAPLTLKGTVTRNVSKAPKMLYEAFKRETASGHGEVYRFGVELEDSPPELLKIISALSADRRRLSRISTQMKCRFVSDDKEYEAQVLDLSREGAFLSSDFIPALQSEVFVCLETDHPEIPLILKGTVTRRADSASSGYGEMVRFGVEFKNPTPGILRLIGGLSARRKK